MFKLPINYDEVHYTTRRKARDEYVRLQEGKCWHCKSLLKEEPPAAVKNLPVSPELFPDGFFKWPVHLHHSHDTGMTIGAVHCYCNAVLWEYYGE